MIDGNSLKFQEPKFLVKFLAEQVKNLKSSFLTEYEKQDDKNLSEYVIHISKTYEFIKKQKTSNYSFNEFLDSYSQIIIIFMFLLKITSNKRFQIDKNDKITLNKLISFFLNSPSHPKVKNILEETNTVLDNIPIKILIKNSDIVEEQFTKEYFIINFFQIFLKEYNRKEQKLKGVYYTPKPLIQFIIKSVDTLLQSQFNVAGIQDSNNRIIDIASGTGIFLFELFKYILEIEMKNPGKKNNLLSLNNFYGFETQLTPYLISKIVISSYLNNFPIYSKEINLLNLYLANTLEKNTFVSKIQTDESSIPILIGNPPYNFKSKNNKPWIKEQIRVYQEGIEGRSKKVLNEDYIKFIRFAEMKVASVGKGIIGFITNSSFLEGPTHRVMRSHLLKTFDKIYILNLHGNTHRGEPDENIFNIKMGITIIIFIKLGKSNKNTELFYYSSLENKYLTKEEKFQFLEKESLFSIPWIKLKPLPPHYWFINHDTSLEKEYEQGFSLTEIFQEFSSGIQTYRDNYTLHHDLKTLKSVIIDLISLEVDQIRNKYNLPRDSEDWSIQNAKTQIKKDLRNLIGKPDITIQDITLHWHKILSERIKTIHYRPFDYRWTYYLQQKGFIARPRFSIMKHLINIKNNIGLIFTPQVHENKPFTHIFISDKIIEMKMTLSTQASAKIAPLYIIKDSIDLTHSGKFQKNDKEVKSNISKNFSNIIKVKYTNHFSSEDILGYIYAVLHSKTYKQKYTSFLRRDFPKIPLVNDKNLFNDLIIKGKSLFNLHLLFNANNNRLLDSNTNLTTYKIQKIIYNENEQTIKVNNKEFINNIPKKIWNYEICGYKVLKRWLRGKKGLKINLKEASTFQHIIKIIGESINIIEDINKLFI
jgi:predicted helicase